MIQKKKFLDNYFASIYKHLTKFEIKEFEKSIKLIKKIKNHNKIIFVGNGGSASIASHCATDFNKFLKKRSTTFNDANFITCYANDYGHENWMKEALKIHGCKNDLLILISSSGESENILKCATQAKKMGIKIITFSGFEKKNKLRSMGNIDFWVDSKNYNKVEMTHHIWILSFVEYLME